MIFQNDHWNCKTMIRFVYLLVFVGIMMTISWYVGDAFETKRIMPGIHLITGPDEKTDLISILQF